MAKKNAMVTATPSRLFGASRERSDVFVKAGPVEVGLAGVPAWAKGTAVVVVAGGVSAGLFRKLSR